MYLIFDTETTGLPKNINGSFSDLSNWPRIVQLAWQIHDIGGNLVKNRDYIIYPDNFDIPYNATKIHGISNEEAKKKGEKLGEVLQKFNNDLNKIQVIIGHNLNFDLKIIGSEFYRLNITTELFNKKHIDNQIFGQSACKISTGRFGKYKYPKLSELYTFLFNEIFDGSHNAIADVNATARCFFELVRRKYIAYDEVLMNEVGKTAFLNNFTSIVPIFNVIFKKKNKKLSHNNITCEHQNKNFDINDFNTDYYFPFHNHTIFSILQSTMKISKLVEFSYEQKFPAVGICDYGNLMGTYFLINEVKKINNKIKEKQITNINSNSSTIMPIIGCEIYISDEYKNKKFTKDNPDRRYTQVLLAKNKVGYYNLCKISTIGFLEGMYMNYPRVGKDVILRYKNNLIATTGSLDSKIPYLILNHGISYAEEEFLWWKNLFNEDYYVQIQNHNSSEEKHVNEVLVNLANKYQVKILVQNSSNYLKQEESDTQDIALCIKSNSLKSTPIGKGFNFRLGMPNNEFYIQDRNQIFRSFVDFIDEMKNYKEFLYKFSYYDLNQEVLLPKFMIPKYFKKNLYINSNVSHQEENTYLRYLAYEGAKKKYIKITDSIKERLELELNTIQNIGYPGYFLIVQDFTNQAKKIGVVVGPGRGSVAGSLVAYCIGITNIDPLKYDLLFERFLNPDRISLPDIDIDFDVKGREKIIDYVVNKYGKNQVAQIITYGKLAGRSAIRDTARVLNLPIIEASKLAKKIPANLSLSQIKLLNKQEISKLVRSEELLGVFFLKDLMSSQDVYDLKAQVIQEASKLEGCIRNTGVHACGIIITSKKITNLIPITVAKEAKLLVSQFDSSIVEKIGLLKMDFLGLKNLTIIQDAINLIEKRRKIRINIDQISITDLKTFELFQKGETVGIFQFESLGMQKYLKALKPDKFDDLIAMNALYRPGPIKYISNFINRKHGIEPITYDLPEMEKYLSSTYGITVYQEQVMLLSQKLANFSKGDADILRKAMGKKQRLMLDKMRDQFINNGKKNNHSERILVKIWKDWENFAEYAFNKSHSTCYSLIAFHTAYLKAHYPSEYMAALLSNNLNQLTTTSYLIEEARKMGIKVLCPNLNESHYRFIADKNGNIRFGLGAIKNIGENTIELIIKEREKNGKFINLFNFLERINMLAINKKVLENLVLSGALDELDIYHRAQYFQKDSLGILMIEKLIKYCNQYNNSKNFYQVSLFDNFSETFEIQRPIIPKCDKWDKITKLQEEKKTIGIYISAHPLDEFKYEIDYLNSINLINLINNKNHFLGKKITIVGMIVKVEENKSLDGKKEFGTLYLEDSTAVMSFKIFGSEYLKYKNIFFIENKFVGLDIELKQSKDKQYIYSNIISMFFLNDVFSIKFKKISFYINLKELNDSLIKELINCCDKNPGDQFIIIILKDNDLELLLYSSKKKIKISRNVLKFAQKNKLKIFLS